MQDVSAIENFSKTETLRRWLIEWDTFCALEPADEDMPEQPALRPEQSLAGETPGPGGIWLLPPSLSPDLPRYVLVHATIDDDTLSLMPFSLFCLPATPGELALSKTHPLAVLCIWNNFTLPAAAVQRGWRVDELTDAECAEATSVQSAMAGQAALPRPLIRRVGSPPRHPLDPRHEYIDREREFTECLARRAAAHGMLRYPQHEPHDLPMAAEQHAPYGTPHPGPHSTQP